jgi:hypothetical protein
MALVLPQDLQLWLADRSQRLGTSTEDTLLDVLYQVMLTEQQEALEAAKAAGAQDLWSGITKEAQAKQVFENRQARASGSTTRNH